MEVKSNEYIEKVRRLAGHSNYSRFLKDSYSDLTDAVEDMPKFYYEDDLG